MAIDDEAGTIRNSRWRKRRKTNNFQSRFVYYSRDSCSIGGGGKEEDIERAFFFFVTFYSAGKIEGGRVGDEGCACFAGRRTAEIRNPVPLVIFRSRKCSREGFPREAINLHPNRGNHYFHRGMAHLQSKQINPSPPPPSSRHEYLVLMLIL